MKKAKKHIRTIQVHPIRFLVYLILYVLNFIMYRFLYSYFNLIIWLVMTIFPIISLSFLWILKKNLVIDIFAQEEEGTVEEKRKLCLKIENPKIAMALDAKITLDIENLFYLSKGTTELSVPVLLKKNRIIYLPFRFDLCGKIRCSIKKIEIWDILGIFSASYDGKGKTTILVLPKTTFSDRSWKSELSAGVTESEESNAKGNDFSEITGIREYHAGDRMKDIHWKISAKKEKMMVKERVSMSDERMFVVIDLNGTKEQTELVLETLYSILKDIKNNMNTKVCWWNASDGDFSIVSVDEVEKIEEIFSKIYSTKRLEKTIDSILYMKTMMKQISSYVYISAENQENIVTIQENR